MRSPEDMNYKGGEDEAGDLLQARDEAGLDLQGRKKR